MTERPILFSAPMVRAILASKKTQTRRLVRGVSSEHHSSPVQFAATPSDPHEVLFTSSTPGEVPHAMVKVAYHAGDTLWVRETVRWVPDIWGEPSPDASSNESVNVDYGHAEFVADDAPCVIDTWPWKLSPLPSIFLPRGASRLTLRVTSVRVERLNEISEADAQAEGVEPAEIERAHRYRDAFGDLWDEINGKRAPWATDPWVWVVSFEAVTP